MKDLNTITVWLAYAPCNEQRWYDKIEIHEGSTVYDALQQSGWLEADPELKAWCASHKNCDVLQKNWRVGVFGVKQRLDHKIQAHDRVEIYRALSQDPMRKRKQAALDKKQNL